LVKRLCLLVQATCALFDNRLASVVTMGLFATGVATFVLLIASHDRPFTGKISVSTEPLLQVIPEDAVPVRV
jgi:hypothetical protein